MNYLIAINTSDLGRYVDVERCEETVYHLPSGQYVNHAEGHTFEYPHDITEALLELAKKLDAVTR